MADLTDAERRSYDLLARDVERVFGPRLVSVVAYQPAAPDAMRHALVLVERLSFDDLVACVPLTDAWHRHGLAVPLLLADDEFRRTIDVFPLEYGGLMARHVLVRGRNPFDGLAIAPADVRRACELQAKSHVIHLREGFLETRGDAAAVADLIAASAQPFRSLLANIARLENAAAENDGALAAFAGDRLGVSSDVVRDVLASGTVGHSAMADPNALLARYVAAAGCVWEYVDRWKAGA
ncbi:MAG TPA: hypothetical protein VFK20_14725 [Vicinamibacterales bacterium]|nr:hypothetical protein [Vicinamibacterales bacterium]